MPIRTRSIRLLTLALVAISALASACSDVNDSERAVVMSDGEEVTIPAGESDAEARILVPFDLSGSGEAERSQYLTWLATTIAPAAAADKASVTVYGIRESTSDYRELGSETFSFDTDNPIVIEEQTVEAAQRLVDEVSRNADALETTSTNITAALRQGGDIIAGDPALPTTISFLSDGVSTSPPPCDLLTIYASAPGPDPTGVAGDCIGSDPIDLHGATVNVFGAASSVGGDITEEIVGISEAVFWQLVSQSGGSRGQWAPIPAT